MFLEVKEIDNPYNFESDIIFLVLWITDGTSIRILKDIRVGPCPDFYKDFHSDGINGLWNGTVENTSLDKSRFR